MPTKTTYDSVYYKTTGMATNQNGSKTDLGTTSSTAKWSNTVTYGENIPGWRDLLRRGLDATTSLIGSESFALLTEGQVACSRPVNPAFPFAIRSVLVAGGMNINSALPAGNPATISYVNADAKALARFGQRMRELHSVIQGGVVIGELGQTLRMIRNPAQGLRRLVDEWGVKARRIRGQRVTPLPFRIKKVQENLADAWLETQFGWKPFLNDVADGMQTLHRYNLGRAAIDVRPIRASAKTEIATPSTVGEVLSLAVWKNAEILYERASVKYRGAIRVEARNPHEMTAELLGFDPGSWLPTAWELTPYSFLIDYFTNVGEVIEGWSTLGTRLAWCNRTVRLEYEKTVVSWTSKTLIRKTTPDIESVSSVPANYIAKKKSVSRAKYTGNFIPALTFEIPEMGNLKWLNIAALIANRQGDRSWSFD